MTLECASGEGWVRMERSTDCDSPIIVITATQGHGAGVGNVGNAPITGPNTQITLGGAGCWLLALLRSLIDLLCLCAEAWLLLVVVVIMMRNESQQRHEWLAQLSPAWSMQPSRGPFSALPLAAVLQCRSCCLNISTRRNVNLNSIWIQDLPR